MWQAASFAILPDCEISGEDDGWGELEDQGMSLP